MDFILPNGDKKPSYRFSDGCGYQSVMPDDIVVRAQIEAICDYLGIEIVTDSKGKFKCIKKEK